MIWNLPAYSSLSQHGDHDTRGFDDGHGVHGGAYGGYDQYGHGGHGASEKKDKDDKKKIMLGAAAGVAAGAIGGAVIADALGKSDHVSLRFFPVFRTLDPKSPVSSGSYTDALFCRR